jgi:hypothetical protein
MGVSLGVQAPSFIQDDRGRSAGAGWLQMSARLAAAASRKGKRR